MKEGWQTVTLEQVCSFRGGATPSKAVGRFWTGDIPWVSSKDMKSDVILDSADHISPEAVESCSVSWIPKDSVVMVFRSGILARTVPIAMAGRDLTINQDLKALLVGDKVQPRFLFYLLRSKMDELLTLASRGATVHRLDFAQVRSLQLALPPLPEQKRIVAVLDEAFEAIAIARANAEKNHENARAIFEGHLESVFSQRGEGRVVRTMADICAITSVLVDPREGAYRELVHVGAGNIESKTSALHDLKTAKEEGLISGKFLFDDSMVLYSKIRPYLVKVARPSFSGLCSADMYPLAPTTGLITRDFLFYLLLSRPFTDYAIQGSARAGMPKVNREHLFAYQVPLPSVEEQTALAEQLDSLREETQRLESVYQRKLDTLDTLKQSFLHHAFSGQL